MFFSSIVSILPELLPENNVLNAYSDLQQGLTTMLRSSTVNNPSFVCAMENVIYKNKEFTVDLKPLVELVF